VHLLLAKDTIDEMMWDVLQDKLHTTGRLLDGQAAHMQVGHVKLFIPLYVTSVSQQPEI
jgi:hypothetical protein